MKKFYIDSIVIFSLLAVLNAGCMIWNIHSASYGWAAFSLFWVLYCLCYIYVNAKGYRKLSTLPEGYKEGNEEDRA